MPARTQRVARELHHRTEATGSPGAQSLPQALREHTSVRLRWAAAAHAAAASLSVGAEALMSRGARPATWVWTPEQVADSLGFGVASLLLSLAFIALLTLVPMDSARVRRLGQAYWITTSLGIALATSYEVHGHLGWVGVWILAGPLTLPTRPRETLFVSLVCATTVPLGYGVHVARGMVELAPLGSLVSFVVPNFICAWLAYGVGAAFYRLGRAVERERRLGTYELVERIGAGAMGEVWRAEHRSLARPAAIKLIKAEHLSGAHSDRATERARLRFEREAQATALLSSPHTIEVFDFGVTDEGTFFIVMELLDGLELQRLLKQAGGSLPPGRAVYLLEQVAHSLVDAHHAGLVHRDIKPANIFVCQKGLDHDFVKVLDFGIAQKVEPEPGEERLTMEGAIVGTPGYMSPEAASGGVADARSDLYSFGCVAYLMLSGREVFEVPGALEQIVMHVTETPEPLSDVAPRPIPADLTSLVMQCLEKDPAARPASMQEVASRLAATKLGQAWAASGPEAEAPRARLPDPSP